MKLTFDVDFEKQTIKRTDDCEPVANSENYLEAEYTCTGHDEGMVLTPVFMRGTKLPVGAKDVYIPSFTQEGDVVTCTVPSEVICGKGFIASIFAYDVNKDERITVDRLIIWLKESGYCGVQIPSKDIYAQILEMLASLNVDEIEAMVKQGEQTIGDGLEALNSAIDNGMTNLNNTADNGMTNINNTVNAGVTTINDNVNAGVTTLANNTNANIDSINAAATANMDNINNVTNTNIGNINDVTNTNLDNINSVSNTVMSNITSAEDKALTTISEARVGAENNIKSLTESEQDKINTNANQHIQNIDAEAEAKIAEIASVKIGYYWEHVCSIVAESNMQEILTLEKNDLYDFEELIIIFEGDYGTMAGDLRITLNNDIALSVGVTGSYTYNHRAKIQKYTDEFYNVEIIENDYSGSDSMYQHYQKLIQVDELEKINISFVGGARLDEGDTAEGFLLRKISTDNITED